MSKSLDQSLREWARRAAPGEERARALEQRIAAAVAREARLGPARAPAGWLGIAVRPLAAFALGAAAAALVFGFGLFRQGGSADAQALALARPANGALAVGQLYAEAERMFGTGLRWIRQSGDQVELGLDPADGPVVGHGGGAVAVHITVLRRTAGDTQWHKAWETDVLSRTEQLVDLAPEAATGNRLRLWLYPVGGQSMAVDTWFSLKAPLSLDTQQSSVVREGVPSRVVDIVEGDTEYRVFQTVTRLAHGANGPC
jgi:hypothetical protein